MDILAQYEKQNPEQKQVPQNMYNDQSEEYGAIIRLVMKVSDGRIQNERQANTVLIIAAGIMIIISLLLIFGAPWSTATDKAALDQMIKLHPEMRR